MAKFLHKVSCIFLYRITLPYELDNVNNKYLWLQTDMLPKDFATGKALEKMRSQYMNYFDSVLQTVAENRIELSDSQSPFRSISNTHLQPDDNPLGLHSLMLKGGNSGRELSKSIYGTEYKQICRLGKGGFGEVFKALNYVDGQEYAVKKIVIPPARIRAIKQKGDKITALLSEVRALAQLNHQNIVRYHHGWIEIVPAVMRQTTGQGESLSYISSE